MLAVIGVVLLAFACYGVSVGDGGEPATAFIAIVGIVCIMAGMH